MKVFRMIFWKEEGRFMLCAAYQSGKRWEIFNRYIPDKWAVKLIKRFRYGGCSAHGSFWDKPRDKESDSE